MFTNPDRPRHSDRRSVRSGWHWLALLGLVAALLFSPGPGVIGAQAQEQVAQIQIGAGGVAEVPAGEVVWRTVRARAEPTGTAPFSPRPLSFVLATEDALLLADDRLLHIDLLFPGEAAFVPPGVTQQRSSLTDSAVNFLAIELVPAAEAMVSDDSTVLQPGQPFPSPGGYHDFDLIQGILSNVDSYTVPDTGQKNIILVTAGTISVGRAGSSPTTLLAGESATFSGELIITGTTEDPAQFVVAVMGNEVIPPAAPVSAEETPAAETPVTETPATETPTGETPILQSPTAEPDGTGEVTTEGTGSITVQALVCPPGMTPQSLFPDQCEVTDSPFEVTLAGTTLTAPRILADATVEENGFRWSDLPLGDYRLAQAVPPDDYETYVLVGARATGDPVTGYTVSLSEETPNLVIQFYNFKSQ
jgi:hypothetical protein